MNKSELKRAITLPGLVFYGVGTMVGGGFYALTGKIAQIADVMTPFAFLLAGLIAFVNAFTYAELSARLPFSAGEARYVYEAFNLKWLAQLVGWLVIFSGIVSAATLAVATIGFLRDLIAVPILLSIAFLIILLALIAIWGITESVIAVVLITIIELAGIIYVFFVSAHQIHSTTQFLKFTPNFSLPILFSILSGAFIGFYAFIGFEDMVNVAEEVKKVRINLPKAILISVAITTFLYLVTSAVMIIAVDPSDIAKSHTPLAAVIKNPWGVLFISIVSILTGINGALIQMIMASRVAYGLAKKSLANLWFSKVNKTTQTPINATLFITGIILILALFFPLLTLAKITSAIILSVFAIVNASLWRLKLKEHFRPKDIVNYPLWIPILGLILCVAMLIFQLWNEIFTFLN